jgi:hypothetical protein
MATKLFVKNAKFEIKKRALETRYQDLEVEMCHRMSLNRNPILHIESKIASNEPTNNAATERQLQNIISHFNNLNDEIDFHIFNCAKDLEICHDLFKIKQNFERLANILKIYLIPMNQMVIMHYVYQF